MTCLIRTLNASQGYNYTFSVSYSPDITTTHDGIFYPSTQWDITCGTEYFTACLTALLVEGNIMWIAFNTCIITD